MASRRQRALEPHHVVREQAPGGCEGRWKPFLQPLPILGDAHPGRASSATTRRWARPGESQLRRRLRPAVTDCMS